MTRQPLTSCFTFFLSASAASRERLDWDAEEKARRLFCCHGTPREKQGKISGGLPRHRFPSPRSRRAKKSCNLNQKRKFIFPPFPRLLFLFFCWCRRNEKSKNQGSSSAPGYLGCYKLSPPGYSSRVVSSLTKKGNIRFIKGVKGKGSWTCTLQWKCNKSIILSFHLNCSRSGGGRRTPWICVL